MSMLSTSRPQYAESTPAITQYSLRFSWLELRGRVRVRDRVRQAGRKKKQERKRAHAHHAQGKSLRRRGWWSISCHAGRKADDVSQQQAQSMALPKGFTRTDGGQQQACLGKLLACRGVNDLDEDWHGPK